MNEPDSTAYNIDLFFKLNKNTDVPKLQKALEAAIDAHPYLNLHLTAGDDGTVYKVLSDEPPQVQIETAREAAFDKKVL